MDTKAVLRAGIALLALLNTFVTTSKPYEVVYCNEPTGLKPEIRIRMSKEYLLREYFPSIAFAGAPTIDEFELIGNNYEKTVPNDDLEVEIRSEDCKLLSQKCGYRVALY